VSYVASFKIPGLHSEYLFNSTWPISRLVKPIFIEITYERWLGSKGWLSWWERLFRHKINGMGIWFNQVLLSNSVSGAACNKIKTRA
jgi:hypothetical protein